MSEKWMYPPMAYKPDPTRPVRFVETEDGRLLLEFFDVEGRMHRIPVVMAIFPYEFQQLKDSLPIKDFFPLLSVDELTYDSVAIREIDTSTATSPQTVIPAQSGKAIEVRGITILTNSTTGSIALSFPASGIIAAKLYADAAKILNVEHTKVRGSKNEALQISWSGLSSGAKIFYMVRYRLL